MRHGERSMDDVSSPNLPSLLSAFTLPGGGAQSLHHYLQPVTFGSGEMAGFRFCCPDWGCTETDRGLSTAGERAGADRPDKQSAGRAMTDCAGLRGGKTRRMLQERMVSVIDERLKANEQYAQQFAWGDLPVPPRYKLAVVACMDARVTVEEMLGLQTGDAHIIRNAGGVVTEDVIRSLLVSHHLLDTQEFMVIQHTHCGMLTFTDAELRTRLRQETGADPDVPADFHAFDDLARSVREQIRKVKQHPWVPAHIPVRGFIFDVKTGRLEEIAE